MAQKRSTGLGGITNLSVLAPIKPGMVIGFEPISFLERLHKVLDAMQSSRQNVRESELRPPFFPDAIGRFGIIHGFRYAIVPPAPGAASQPEDGTWRLSLNVTFDGGWEPYMRVIYRDLGTLLDLLFCHCDGYPGSRTSRFEDYCDWVRRNEVEGGIFYADSPMPLGDHAYLAAVEKLQREHGDDPATDAAIARLASASEKNQQASALAAAIAAPMISLVLPMRTLKGLYRLSLYFPKDASTPDEGALGTLRRFAQSVLDGPMKVMDAMDKTTDPTLKAWWAEVQLQYKDELVWLRKPPAPIVLHPPLPYDPTQLQAPIYSKEPMTHGCLILLRIDDPTLALPHFDSLFSLSSPVADSKSDLLIAFTYAGLQRLGIAQSRLEAFPREFVDGMEARCALLGDVRGNHPDRWTLPLAYGEEDKGHRIEMKAVHLVIQLRLSDPREPSVALNAKLQGVVDGLQAVGTGLHVLAVQPTRSYRNTEKQSTGHFGFADGISQPQFTLDGPPAGTPPPYSDDTRFGELLLGHGNDRGDRPNPGLDPLLLNGSFLVVRKLRQRVDTLDAALDKIPAGQREELLSKMMGREKNGTPLAPLLDPKKGLNYFNYDSPQASEACPFHAHIRRANPRDGRTYTPRLLRRGMSYGPMSESDRVTERGLVFMAYCASIAEQFETIQRWITGGNSSGVSASQADAFLSVPQIGESRTIRYLDARKTVARVAFDDKPLVQLEWGLYLFVPSLTALKLLGGHPATSSSRAAAAVPPMPPTAEEQERERVRQLLDDEDRARIEWKKIRDHAPDALQDTAYGHMLGTCTEVLGAMSDRTGSQHSVKGYGDRMGQSIGLNLLGMDPGADRTRQEPLNLAIEAVTEAEAFATAAAIVQKVLARFPAFPQEPTRRPIDLISFSDFVLAGLCQVWIGLPDSPANVFMDAGGRLDETPPKPRCPGNFATASRYIFSPQPRKQVRDDGQAQGQSVLKAVEVWLDTTPKLGKLAEDIKTGLGSAGVPPKSLAVSLAGVLLGFPPTVHGNFIRTMETWIKTEALWQHQETLLEAIDQQGDAYPPIKSALLGPLFATMRQRPVPEMLWRSPVTDGKVDLSDKGRHVLGIASALTDSLAPDDLMFGRNAPAEPRTEHGCPGYNIGVGVLLAMLSGLMKAGTLRPTGSPVLLILTER